MFISNMPPDDRCAIKEHYHNVRAQTMSLAAPLGAEDQTVQTMPDVSPTKWHLAHTSWFFETFLLKPFLRAYQEKHSAYNYFYNSYYEQIGAQWPRAQRGLLSRPSVSEVRDYRRHVDQAITKLVDEASAETWPEIASLMILGFHHEWQHQELLLTDIKHVIAHNPLRPAVYQQEAEAETATSLPSQSLSPWLSFEGGAKTIGCADENQNFCFDNETPAHQKLVPSFCLAETLTTNRDYLDFIEDGGYENPALWLSDGWAQKQSAQWAAPLYWRKDENTGWQEFTLAGEKPLQQDAPVVHVSYYEAAAYAAWADKRLPREEEIEIAAADMPIRGNLGRMVKDGVAQAVHPQPTRGDGLRQIYGDVWEWTQSPYLAYPGYRAAKTAIGEYNGKFMCNQFVLKGGSCATAKEHMRASYRNFSPPDARWQFTGIRLAKDD